MWHRPVIPFIVVLFVLTGCKVERTPPEYYEDRFLPGPDLEERREQVRGVLAPLADVRTAAEVGSALEALPTTPDAQIVEAEWHEEAGEVRLPPSDLSVMVAETGSLGWFVSRHGDLYAISGVAERRDGTWHVVQVHAGPIQPLGEERVARDE